MLSALRRPVLRALTAHRRNPLPWLKFAGSAESAEPKCRCLSISHAKWGKSGRKSPPASSSDSDDEVSGELRSAVRAVAESLPGEKSRTESDLLRQLRQHRGGSKADSPPTDQQPSPTPSPQASSSRSSSSSLLKGMRVQTRRDRDEPLEMKKQPPRIDTFKIGQQQQQPRQEARQQPQQQRRPQEDPSLRADFRLFEGKRLGVFSSPPDQAQPRAEGQQVSELWERVLQEELERAGAQPPASAWEEMIQWTEEGKLWTFPINNEAGMEEEADVGFHEHVFLEPLLAGFPARGPIRHFMELVLVGLSKNPHLTVREKHQHVAWFRDYFAQKQALLEPSLGKEGLVSLATKPASPTAATDRAAAK